MKVVFLLILLGWIAAGGLFVGVHLIDLPRIVEALR